MNWVTINGKPSTEIRGLLIQQLPPIVKPMVRTVIEEIEGRDGDIVTDLGYMAYDRTLTIGLYGTYNVDDAIEYFDQKGTIIFSNEPDKYYTFETINQIDFQRLIRFRTAEVVLHCQPFKYSLVEKEKTFNTTSVSSISVFNSGNIKSKPRYRFTGVGNVNVTLNSNVAVSIAFGNESREIIIDVADYEALDTSGNYANRSVTGDYDALCLEQGVNTLTWSGTLTSISVIRYSRWR